MSEDFYWQVVRGRVAVLSRHHKATIAAHKSLFDVLKKTGNWEKRKEEYHDILVEPGLLVEPYESWWRDMYEAHHQAKLNGNGFGSDDDD